MPLGDALQGLITLAAVVVGAGMIGNLFCRFGQPGVLGPIVLGIAVGSVVAALPAAARSVLVPATSQYLLDAVGTAGLLLLMFSVGSELRGLGAAEDPSPWWRLVPGVLIPMAICAVAAWPFAGRLGQPGTTEPHGWLFVGVALGVTAVPVLVTIVRDLGIASLPTSRMALRIALGTDGFAWILVTALVIITSDLTAVSVPMLAVGVALLLSVTVLLPRAFRRKELPRHGRSLPVMMVISALAGSAGTQFLGFHPAIGAVVAGFFFPAGLAGTSSRRTFTSVVNVLLPAFFVSAAMSVPLQAIRDQLSWVGLWCMVVLAIAAFASKLAAGFACGAIHRWPWRSSARLGVLLNCRGVTEIAIASVGFQAGLIGPFGFAALCGLAILTTAVTAPLYRALATAEDAGDSSSVVVRDRVLSRSR